MSVGLIIEQKKVLNEIEENIGKNIVFSKHGTFTADEVDEIMVQASRADIRHLVISLGAIEEERYLAGSIRKYKNTRPTSQIIILADNRIPGDATIFDLVNLAVYDYIALETEDLDKDVILNYSDFILDKINNPGNFASGERWRVGIEARPKEEGREKRDKNTALAASVLVPVKESVIINQEKIIGNILVGVTSAYPGAGATFASVQVAHFLSNYGKTAVIDLVDKDVSNKGLEYIFDQEDVKEGSYKKVDYYIVRDDKDFINALGQGYTYIVIDFGHLYNKDQVSKYIDDLMRCHLHLLVTGKSSWNVIETLLTLSKLKVYDRDWNLLVSPVSQEEVKELSREFEYPDINFCANPYVRDPSDSRSYDSQELLKIFRNYIPSHLLEKKKRGRFWRW